MQKELAFTPEQNRELCEVANDWLLSRQRPGTLYNYDKNRANLYDSYRSPTLNALAREVFKAAREYIAEHDDKRDYDLNFICWTQYQRAGTWITPHQHIGAAQFTCLYYPHIDPVMENAPIKDSGRLIFLDPRASNRNWDFGRESTNPAEKLYFQITPRPNLMLVFPSWLVHAVAPYYPADPNGVRVSYTFDIEAVTAGAAERRIAEKEII